MPDLLYMTRTKISAHTIGGPLECGMTQYLQTIVVVLYGLPL